MGSSKNCPDKVWGKCTKSCASKTTVQEITTKATHYVAFGFKHWLNEIDVYCEDHGYQCWTVEKERAKTTPNSSSQIYKNHCIVMWCGYYATYMIEERRQIIHANTLHKIVDYITNIKENGYMLMHDNCATFSNDIWFWVIRNCPKEEKDVKKILAEIWTEFSAVAVAVAYRVVSEAAASEASLKKS
jgi:hypothetical protein